MRSPWASTSCRTLLGKSRHKPSTFNVSSMSWKIWRSLVPKSSGDSFQGVGGLVLASRTRIHDTAVSWSLTYGLAELMHRRDRMFEGSARAEQL